MSLGIGAYKVDGAGQRSSMSRRYPWQPCKGAPTRHSHTEQYSVEYLLTNA